MNAKQGKQEAVNALKDLSMRKLRTHVAFWESPEAREVLIVGLPPLFWVIDQAAKARDAHDAQARLRALAGINWLLDRGFDANAVHKSNTVLMEASIFGDVAAARRLIHAGAQVNARSPMGNTALHWAALAGRPGMCKFLLSQGADLEASNHNRQTPLHCAASKLRMNTINALHEAGASWEHVDVNDKTPLQVLGRRDKELARFWTNKPERDRLAKGVEVPDQPSSSTPSRSRRL